MTLDDPVKVLAWLQRRPSASELRSAFPAEWDSMERELEGALQTRDPSRLHRLLNAEAPSAKRRVRGTPGRKEKQALARTAVRQQMARVALQRYATALATSRTSGKIRFNLFNGWLTQRLLFRRGLERKPVSMTWFRLLWPLVWQKRYLMPLVEPRGIYCFYSKQFIRQLKEIIGGRGCLEVGAGDGTLTRFLQEAGVRATATDDHSWAHRIAYPESVIRMDAHTALHEYPSAVVICSWPPAGNDFEREILRSDDVDIYLAIVSVHRAASGNWRDYEQQTRFTLERRPDLARLLLPPELGCDVLMFTRRPAAAA
ncbi:MULTISPECIES: SAM-dependent methyltransferase [unclassified Burkholderia]|uniref:SAM-dependent methyltransferase n=1 Tax=unclassified Burkholderia TaxID=2613784 RepID=UPI0010F8C5E3|nr:MULTISPECIES: SAM-dependent methyltransferase [unclassified Burkholderia]